MSIFGSKHACILFCQLGEYYYIMYYDFRGEPQVHGAAVHGGGARGVGPGVPDDGVGRLVAVLRVVRPRRALPHAPAARARRPPAGLLRQGRAHAAAALPGAGELRHRHDDR